MAVVYHGIFTNAFGERGEGFRTFFLGPPWPPAEKARVERFLCGLRPLPGVDPSRGTAVSCFRLGGTVHVCQARFDPDFALDEHGRSGGFLVHALLLPLDEGTPAGDFGGALLRLLHDFERPPMDDVDRLEFFISQCKLKSEVRVGEADVGGALGLPDLFWWRLLEVSMRGARLRDVPWPVEDDADLAAQVVLAGALLPPRLRLSLRWAYRLRPPSPDMVLLREVPAVRVRPPNRRGLPQRYVEWMRRTAEDGRLEEIRKLASDWQISAWNQVEQEILK